MSDSTITSNAANSPEFKNLAPPHLASYNTHTTTARVALGVPLETEAENAARLAYERDVWGTPGGQWGHHPFICNLTPSEDVGVTRRHHRYERAFESHAPVKQSHWFRTLHAYVAKRPDLERVARSLQTAFRQRDVSQWADSPKLAPILREFLSEHPARAAHFEWCVEHLDLERMFPPLRFAPGVWAQ